MATLEEVESYLKTIDQIENHLTETDRNIQNALRSPEIDLRTRLQAKSNQRRIESAYEHAIQLSCFLKEQMDIARSFYQENIRKDHSLSESLPG